MAAVSDPTGSRSRSYPLRGRMSELDIALRAIRAARTGIATVLVVEGEPGIGKTSFAAEVAEQARRLGFAVGQGTATEQDNVAPLASLGTALRAGRAPLVGSADFTGLAPLLDQPLWLAERLCELLARRTDTEPVLVLLDDVQWADPLSVFMLRVVTARLADRPIAWLLAGRPTPGGPADQAATAARRTVPVHRIALPPLTTDAVLELAGDRLGGRPSDHLGRRLRDTGGLPFLAVHIVEGLVETGARADEDLPAGLVEGVRRRVGGLSAPARALLRVGVVLGMRFSLHDVATLSAVPIAELTDPLVEAMDAGLLTDDGNAVAFRHDLLRQALYQDVPPSARRALHDRVVEHFLSSGRTAADAAPHVLATAQVGDLRAVRVLRDAALDIVGSMAVTSVAFIKQAFELVDANDAMRAEVGRDVVTVLVAAHQFDEALTFAAELLRGTVDADIAATVRLTLAPWLWANDRRDDLLLWTEDSPASPALRTRLRAYRSLAGDSSTEDAEDPVARAVQLAAAAENLDRAGVFGGAAETYRAARASAESAGDAVGCPDGVVLALRELLALGHAVDPQRALAELEAVRTMPRSSWYAPQIELLAAQLALGLGQVERATRAAEAAAQRSTELGESSPGHQLWHIRAILALLRGDAATARQLTADHPMRVVTALLAEPGAGDELLDAIHVENPPWRDHLLAMAAQEPRIRDAATRSLADLAQDNPSSAGIAGAAMIARRDLAPAVDTLRTAHRPLLLALALQELGRAELSGGHRDTGVALLDETRDLYAELGADADALRVQRLLHAAGVRRRRWPHVPPKADTGWDALTATERRVAELVADGHTNKSAAEVLTVSPSTVNTHLRAVFTKLGVNSRVQLTRLLITDQRQ